MKMPFKKLMQSLPPRFWGLRARPGDGKSTFAAQMAAPLLAIDADHRFGEVRYLTAGDIFVLSEDVTDNNSPERIAALLDENMPGSGVRTIAVDSVPAIIAPRIMKALREREAMQARNAAAKAANPGAKLENLMTVFQDKALAIRTLQDAVTKWGVDVLWVWHLQDGRDQSAKKIVTETISHTEIARLTRSLNVLLEVVVERENLADPESRVKRRGIKVTWARQGRQFPEVPVLYDDAGFWKGMPERIETAVYGGLTPAAQQAIANRIPTTFADASAAVAWGLEQGVFKALQHARNAFEGVAEASAATGDVLWGLWVADVLARKDKDKEQPEAAPASVAGGDKALFYRLLGEYKNSKSVPFACDRTPPLADHIRAGDWPAALAALAALHDKG